MRLNKLIVDRNSYVDDGYGGKVLSSSSNSYVYAKYNVTDNDLKALSDGYGFYKQIFFLTRNDIHLDDLVHCASRVFKVVEISQVKGWKLVKGVQND